MDLTLPMMRALWGVRNTPGQQGNEYQGGWRSIDALRRRRLVIVNADGSVRPTAKGAEVHLHEFRTTLHMDGCHWYSTAGRCECGATYKFYGERDLKGDPYSAIWMEPTGEPDEEPCPRCQELMDGARPVFREQIYKPKARAA